MAIKLTPLVGAHDSTGLLSYLLEIDEGRILLDCGCPDRPALGEIDPYLNKLAELAPTLDLVLLSHPLLSSLGLVPLLRSRLGLRCPVYATLPTKEMGRWAAEEWIAQRALEESNGLENSPGLDNLSQSQNPTLSAADQSLQNAPAETESSPKSNTLNQSKSNSSDQIWKVSFKELRDAFDSVIAVRYSQPIHLGGKLRPLTLTAHKSGHTIGGTIWSLRSPLHTVSSASSSTLIYAPIFNHVRESHLDSAALVQATGDGSMRIGLGMSRPMVMVVGTERSLIKSIRKKDRDRILLDSITETLRSSRTVLIPTDPSARLIELLLILDNHWTQLRLDSFPLCLVSQTGKDVVTFIRSLTEWMSPALARSSFDQSKRGGRDQNDHGPLRLRHVRFFNSVEALEAELPIRQPKVILAVPLSMEYGFSRAMFTRLAGVPGNLIILTSLSSTQVTNSDTRPDRLLDQLASIADVATKQHREDPMSTSEVDLPLVVQLDSQIDVELRQKVILEGDELEQYLDEERRALERKAKAAAMLARSRQLMEDEESDESGSESESETDAIAVARTLTGGGPSWDEFVDEKEPMAFDIYVKGGSATRFSGGRTQTYRMFPVVERRRKVDGYGEVVDVDGWLRRGDAVDEAIQRAESGGRKATKEDLINSLPVDPPSKFVAMTETIQVKCNVLMIDLEGKADGRALKTIIPQINPKTVVLVNGSTTSNDDFASSVAGLPSFTKQVFSPRVGEQGTVGHDTKSFSVRLGDSIMSSLRFSEVEGFDVAYISGSLEVSNESSIPTLERSAGGREPPTKMRRLSVAKPPKETDGTSEGKQVVGRLEPLASLASGSAIFIGDLRLAGLKSYLISHEIPAEFVAEGVLVCGPVPFSKCLTDFNANKSFLSHPSHQQQPADLHSAALKDLVGGTVSVRKSSKGQLIIDGSMGITFFAVREAIYHLHARTKC